MKATETYLILCQMDAGEITLQEAHELILRLFDVSMRSEQLECVDCDYVRINDNCIECRKCGDVKDVAL